MTQRTEQFPIQPSPEPPPRRHWKRWVAGGAVGVVVLVAGISIANAGSHPAAPAAPRATTSAPAMPSATLAAPVPSTAAPAPAAPPPPANTAPAMTSDQQQAVQSAQGYLTDGEGFSYAGLLQQLTSAAGDGFSNADATFAINYLNPNWDQQAVESAQGYLDDGEGFSKSSLLQQLTSTYGEGFTNAQAEYAISKTMG